MIRTSRPPSVHSLTMDPGDPFSALMRPPPTETEEDRAARLQREAEAKRISESIDEQIKLDRERYKKNKEEVKLLLLGQAESGKSTLQKQFQLMYNPTSLEEERLSWRTVIYYNITRPVRRILEALDSYSETEEDDESILDGSTGSPQSTKQPPYEVSPGPDEPQAGSSHDAAGLHTLVSKPSSLSTDQQLQQLRLRLSPLLSVEASLADRLSGGVDVSGSGKGSVFVRSGWQETSSNTFFGRKSKDRGSKGRFSLSGSRPSIDVAPPSLTPETEEEALHRLQTQASKDTLAEEVASILSQCQEDVKELWKHPLVRFLRATRKLRLEEWAEYFLNNITRVSSHGYIPTTDDILHARIQTMGVAEHTFEVSVHSRTLTWHLYDVGGARGQRHTWIPYFDDATAIIFMAPVSAFDQYLDEDPRVNRVDDSLKLFKQICSNSLLKNAHLVLFLNKTDLLQSKLERGVKVSRYITSYGDRPNDFDSVITYFKTHFIQVHKRNNENKRVLYNHLTSVVDTKATQAIIANVRDSLFRGYLKNAALV